MSILAISILSSCFSLNLIVDSTRWSIYYSFVNSFIPTKWLYLDSKSSLSYFAIGSDFTIILIKVSMVTWLVFSGISWIPFIFYKNLVGSNFYIDMLATASSSVWFRSTLFDKFTSYCCLYSDLLRATSFWLGVSMSLN